jgi:hypothetical protein
MKKNNLIMILIMSFALIMPTIAEQENLILGPYEVSFDMGIEELLNWVVSKPIYSEPMDGSLTFTKYSATVATLTESQFYSELKRLGRTPSTHTVYINIIRYNSTKDESLNGTKTMVESAISKRTIDGRSGTIGTASSGAVYVADWWLDNNTIASVISTYPWDEGTLSLLKTVHIERINAT